MGKKKCIIILLDNTNLQLTFWKLAECTARAALCNCPALQKIAHLLTPYSQTVNDEVVLLSISPRVFLL